VGLLLLPACLARFEVGEIDGGSDGESDTSANSNTGNETASESGTEGNGACASPCEGDESCVMGECVAMCPVACDATLEICVGGECVCRFGFTPCGGMCVDLDSDTMNCGECGDACAMGVCSEGNCESEGCQESTDCDGMCVSLEQHPLHCGSCDHACAGDELCIEGECVGYQLVDCGSDLDCRAGVCCSFEEQGSICVDGDSCP
jgi:hypothetical protein